MPAIDRHHRRTALLALAGLATLPLLARAQLPAPGVTGRVRFVGVEEGRSLIAGDDDWIQATSDFQRAATLGAPPPVSRERLREFLATTVLPWPAEEESRWQAAVATAMARIVALHLPVPPEVLLVNTDGRDAAGAPYTRGNAIFLPTRALAPRDGVPPDAFVIAHELFHVISRKQPFLANRLYALIGFQSVEALVWPIAWLPARIANPDAPLDRHAMRTTVEGREVWLMPVLVARRTELRPGETFFSVLDLRLLEVTVEPGRPTLPVMQGSAPAWHSPAQAPAYVARLGGNTGYILHPEETIADNVALLVTGGPARNVQLLAEIEAVLTAPR